MQTFNSNTDSPPVSATASELPVQKHIIGEDSGLETVISNVDTPSSGVLQNPANIVQSNTLSSCYPCSFRRIHVEGEDTTFLSINRTSELGPNQALPLGHGCHRGRQTRQLRSNHHNIQPPGIFRVSE
ncbi:hypothetical protein BDR05DRAFT_54483 [Suillus weaverae]|nr:hypothetical protein BDR05DRAFT_54483 [Suillus weaverae]